MIVYGIGFYYVNKEIGDTVGRNPLENNEIRNFLFMAGMYAVKLSGGYHGSAHLSNHPLWRDFHGDNTDLSSKTCTTVGNCSRQMDRIHVYADIIFTTDGWRNDDFGLLDIGIYGSKFIRKLTFSLVERHSPSFCFIRGWVSALNSREWRSGVWSLRSRLHWWMDRAYWFAHQQSDCNQYRYYLQLDHPKRSTMETRSPRNVFSPRENCWFFTILILVCSKSAHDMVCCRLYCSRAIPGNPFLHKERSLAHQKIILYIIIFIYLVLTVT